MNVLIVDTDNITLELANKIYQDILNHSDIDDLIAIPKGIDIMRDVSVDWMKMIRDRLDEKIREIEGDVDAENANGKA